MRFKNRFQAGRFLASLLLGYKDRDDVLVLALPRGGVPVGHEVAQALRAPLDVLVVRKIGIPGYPELGIGALAVGGVEAISEEAVRYYGVDVEMLHRTIEEEREELGRRERLYRDDLPFPAVRGKIVILVDDGLATGSTMEAAVESVSGHGAAKVVVAVPVGAADTCLRFRERVDEVVCAHIPVFFSAVGEWYSDFSQTTDEEVERLLRRHAGAHPVPP